MKTKDKTICLCAIVKNEAFVLPRLIESCRGIIDYWVIIDTGSTDNTIEVIEKSLSGIPGELFHSEFINFGVNRTELVRKAKDKADYLLLMDADMTVVTLPSFRKNDLIEDWYMLRYTGDLDFAQPLLVKGSFDWRYEGVTHEYNTADGIKAWKELNTLYLIHHSDGGMRYEKLERDRRLLEKAFEGNPNDTRSCFYLGQTYANMKEYDKSIEFYTKRALLKGWEEEVFYSLLQIGILLKLKGNIDSAILQFLETYSMRPSRFEPLYQIGLIYREQKKYHLASIFFEQVINQVYPYKDVLFIHKDQFEYLSDFELGICYFYMRDYKKAKKHCEKVKRYKGVSPIVFAQNEKNLEYSINKLENNSKQVNEYIICSMFTVGTPYEEEVKKLQASMDKFGLKYELVGIKPQGSWIKNTQMKPKVIKSVMEKYNQDIVWVDADAIFLKHPSWLNSVKCDISFYTINEWKEKLVGTLYLSNNQKVINFLDNWIYLNDQNDYTDGFNFQTLMDKQDILPSETDRLNIVPLPADYIKIFDNDLICSSDPVIIHNQASRRFKLLMNNLSKKDGIKTILNTLKKDQTVCSVIGNGPFHSDLSSGIDKSFVVRCNRFSLNGYKEIGRKTDLNISSLYHEIIPDQKVNYPIFGILPISGSAYQQYTTAKSMHILWQQNGEKLINKGNQVWMYDDNDSFIDVFKDVCESINAFPTVGMMGIAMARWMGFKKIILSGFTFFQTEQSHYDSLVIVKPSGHHNPIAERDLLRKWIDEDQIEYILDDYIIQNLNFKKHATIRSD
jgi:tetratricopeptide (TPR) repeat protein